MVMDTIAFINEGLPYAWRFVGFYGHHEASKWKFSWKILRHVDSLFQLPTVYMGDFNQRRPRPAWKMNNQVVKDCGIFDLGCKGYPRIPGVIISFHHSLPEPS
ncbi:hypothetical protein LIER_34482 [Lithospermum erythrorhizon]|uniref:Endonuclease/exonuclease/phosphatase domain-containing protein n=1 Tax=Lithospermum erythrorhizon TaxID=34254 RepID=A0AAV3S0E9_LITER